MMLSSLPAHWLSVARADANGKCASGCPAASITLVASWVAMAMVAAGLGGNDDNLMKDVAVSQIIEACRLDENRETVL
uniref:SERPIN domain-containing protein n=1 Tax=Panagrellus redivivus TaxID=6233 RepID=A0A7E4VAC1_PANRE